MSAEIKKLSIDINDIFLLSKCLFSAEAGVLFWI